MKSKMVYQVGDTVYNSTLPGYYEITEVLDSGHYVAKRIADAGCQLVLDKNTHILSKMSTTEAAIHALSELKKQEQRVELLLMVMDGTDENYLPFTLEDALKRNEAQQPQ